MKESKFQSNLRKELKEKFPGSIVTKLDSSDIQGIPDLLILYKKKFYNSKKLNYFTKII